MSATPSQDVPTGHLAGLAYFNSPTKLPCLPSASLPVPPTPRKMMLRTSLNHDPLPLDGRRRSFVSAIPRPASGTSRQLSPSNPRNKPLPGLPRSESMLPYLQRPQDDLSGVRQQLPVRRYARKSLASPSEIQTPSSTFTPSRLPKSATSVSISTRTGVRKITPGRRLLGPIQPPLPHSQSTSNLPDHDDESIVSIDEAIRDSRMTQDEIDLLNQVQKEAVRNQTRLRAKYGTPPSSPRSPRSEVDKSSIRRKPRTPLMVDTDLANAAARTHTTVSIESNSNDGTVETETIDPKHVYFGQDVAYWTGRYMAISDRLRGESMEIALKSGPTMADSPEPASSQSYESRDRQRMLSALYELRSYCKTDKARASFEIFENQLKQGKSWGALAVSTSLPSIPVLSSQYPVQYTKTRVHQIIARSKVPEDTQAIAQPIIASPVDRRKPQVPLPNIWGRLAMTRSKTMGNMATVTSDPEPAVPQNQPRPVATLHHRRQSSTQLVAQSIPTVWQEKDKSAVSGPLSSPRLPALPAQHTRQSSNTTIDSVGSTKAGSTAGSEGPKRPQMCHCRTSSRTVGRFDELYPGVSVSSIESGHRPAPPPPPGYAISPISPMTARSMPTAKDREGFFKSRRSKHRRSSGEALKGLLSAGIEQVRKMGRRVGGSESWTLSGDDDPSLSSSNKR